LSEKDFVIYTNIIIIQRVWRTFYK